MSFSIGVLWEGKRAVLASDTRLVFLDGTYADGEAKILRLGDEVFVSGTGGPWIFEILASFLGGLIVDASSVFEVRRRLEKLREGFSPIYEHTKDGFGQRYFLLKNCQIIALGRLGSDIFISSINWASGANNDNFSNTVSTRSTFIMSCPDGDEFIEKYVPRMGMGLLEHAADWPSEKLAKILKEIFLNVSGADSKIGSSGNFVMIEAGKDPIEGTF
jgi:hypothetical protein